MSAGRPMKYIPFLAILEDEKLYTPADIVTHGKACGLFEDYQRLNEETRGAQEEPQQLYRKIRHTLGRFAKNHKFPNEGDGLVFPKGQAPRPGWNGHRWKKAVQILEHAEQSDTDEPMYVAPIDDRLDAQTLLEKRAFFRLEGVARVLGFDAAPLAGAARALISGDHTAWDIFGIAPMIHGHWLVSMPLFARFYQEYGTRRQGVGQQWTTRDLLEFAGVVFIEHRESNTSIYSPEAAQAMSSKERKEAGIWYPQQFQCFAMKEKKQPEGA